MRSADNDTLEAEIARLNDLGLAELRGVWKERLGTPPAVTSTDLMRRWLSWELQARPRVASMPRRVGALDSSARRFEPIRRRHRCPILGPKPGSMLTREWNGVTHRVMVLEEGFAWNGQKHASLSEIAQTITGTRWSGPRFFGLRQQRKS